MAELAQLVDGVSVHKIPLELGCIHIGRQDDNDIHLVDTAVSGHHAKISVEENTFIDEVFDVFIEDLQSTNGCFINDERIKGKVQINHNDIIRVGWNEFQLLDRAEDAFEATAHILHME